jgi:ankyrin
VLAGKDDPLGDLAALHLAAAEGHTGVIQQLAAAGAYLEAQTARGYTALHLAAANGRSEAVRQLLTEGACLEAQTHGGDTALHLAVRRHQVEAVAQLIAAGSNVSAPTSNNWLPLHLAVQCAEPAAVCSMVQQLAAAGAAVDARGGPVSCTPLMHACRIGSVAAIKQLRQAGAAEEAVVALLQVTQHLLEDSSRSSKTWKLPCSLAREQHGPVLQADLQVVKALLAPVEAHDTATAAPATTTAPAGTAALVAAIEDGRADVVKVLLQAGAAVTATTSALGSPLSAAAATRQADIVALLLQFGAMVDAVDIDGSTALMRATASQSVSVVKMLLQAGAAVNARNRQLGYLEGCTALHMAVMLHPEYSRPTAAATKVVVQALLGAGADASAAMLSGVTALHLCARHWQASVSQLLLDAGAQLEAHTCTLPEGEFAAAASNALPAFGAIKAKVLVS